MAISSPSNFRLFQNGRLSTSSEIGTPRGGTSSMDIVVSRLASGSTSLSVDESSMVFLRLGELELGRTVVMSAQTKRRRELESKSRGSWKGTRVPLGISAMTCVLYTDDGLVRANDPYLSGHGLHRLWNSFVVDCAHCQCEHPMAYILKAITWRYRSM